MVGAVAVSALVVLARCLPGDAELGRDLRPPDAEVDGAVDQDLEFGLGVFSCESGAIDLF
jgi:hypothetical protein